MAKDLKTKEIKHLMQVHAACFWIKREANFYNCPNIFALIDAASEKYNVRSKDVMHVFKGMYPDLYPLGDVE